MAQNHGSGSKIKLWQSALLRGVLFVAGFVVSFLPRRAELWLGPKLGLCLVTLKSRFQIAFENVSHCFPELKTTQREDLLKRNYQHYGILVFELLHLFSPIPGHYLRYSKRNVLVEGFENWKCAHEKGRGVIFVSSHLGNWELMAASSGLKDIPLTIATKHLKPEWLHLKIESARLSVKVRSVYEPRTLPLIMKALRKGESVGFVVDQYAGPPLGSDVNFFGVKVGTLAAMGTLVHRTGAAVIPVQTYRDAKGIIHACIESEMVLEGLTAEQTTQAIAHKVEGWVRQYPDQWLWIHRRFKNVVWPEQVN